jgi:hypothetical protein
MNNFIRYLSDFMLMVWRFNCTIRQLWATNTSAFIYIQSPAPAGWRKLAVSDINMFDLAKFAKIYNRLVHVFEDPATTNVIIIHMP